MSASINEGSFDIYPPYDGQTEFALYVKNQNGWHTNRICSLCKESKWMACLGGECLSK